MTKGRLVKWLKGEGERVKQYDILFEVETEELVEEVFKVGKEASEAMHHVPHGTMQTSARTTWLSGPERNQ